MNYKYGEMFALSRSAHQGLTVIAVILAACFSCINLRDRRVYYLFYLFDLGFISEAAWMERGELVTHRQFVA